MSGWQQTALGEVLTQRRRPVSVEQLEVVRWAGVRWYAEGVYARPEEAAPTVKTATLNEIALGDITYNRMWATKAAFGVVTDDAHGCLVSNDFPIFQANAARLLPEFLRLLFQTSGFQQEAARRATGTTERRRLKEADFLAISVALPPLQQQRRIVDLIASVDATIEALQTEMRTGMATRSPMIESLLKAQSIRAPERALGEVGAFIRGRRFTKSEYVDAGLGCIHYGQVHTHLGPVTTKALTFLPEESRNRLRLARPGDVVVAATSENTEDLAKATVWLGDDQVAVHDDCYIFRHSLDPRFAAYLFVSPQFCQQKVAFAAGTKVTRISGANLARIEVPIPPADVQARIGDALSEVDAYLREVDSEVASVRLVRSMLLASLLAQAMSIPESYDSALGAAS